jgi:hypothetical protein
LLGHSNLGGIFLKKNHAVIAANALTNLNTWAAIMALLESGLLYEGHNSKAVQKVIDIAKNEQARHLKQYEDAIKGV